MPRFFVPGATVLALAAFLVFFSACAKSGSETAKAPPTTIAVAKAAREDLIRNLVLTAEFKPFQEVEVMAKVSGFVRAINVDIGDRVSKGELIAMLEVPEMKDDLDRAKATLKRSMAEAARARDELKHAQSLHDIANLSYTRLAEVDARRAGLVAQQEIDDAKSKALTTEAQVDASRSGLEAANQQIDVSRGALARVKTMLDYARVTAPFAGIVTKRFADVGSMIQAGTASQSQAMPLVRLYDSYVLRLILPVPESAVPTIHIGQHVEVRIPSLKRSVSGSVTRFANSVSVGTRTMDTEVDVQNTDLTIIPGMFAEVRLVLDQHKGALAVPISAVDQGGDQSSTNQQRDAARTGRLLVVTPANLIEIRTVTLGLETANKAEVLTGLKEGELVVIGGRSGLQGGQKVRPKMTTMGAENR
jgi:RND family efflux transporter MFP subunit